MITDILKHLNNKAPSKDFFIFLNSILVGIKKLMSKDYMCVHVHMYVCVLFISFYFQFIMMF